MKKQIGIASEKYDMFTLGVSSIGVVVDAELVAFKNLRFWI